MLMRAAVVINIVCCFAGGMAAYGAMLAYLLKVLLRC